MCMWWMRRRVRMWWIVYEHGTYSPSVTVGEAERRSSTGVVLTGSVNPGTAGEPEPPAHLEECYFLVCRGSCVQELNPVGKGEGRVSRTPEGSMPGAGCRGSPRLTYRSEVTQPVHVARRWAVGRRNVPVPSGREHAGPRTRGGLSETEVLAFTAPGRRLRGLGLGVGCVFDVRAVGRTDRPVGGGHELPFRIRHARPTGKAKGRMV